MRPITILGLQLYDKKLNETWQKNKSANTPLALIHNVNFKIKDINYGLEKNYLEMLKKGEIDKAQLQSYIDKYNNVIKEMRIRWIVIKD